MLDLQILKDASPVQHLIIHTFKRARRKQCVWKPCRIVLKSKVTIRATCMFMWLGWLEFMQHIYAMAYIYIACKDTAQPDCRALSFPLSCKYKCFMRMSSIQGSKLGYHIDMYCQKFFQNL